MTKGVGLASRCSSDEAQPTHIDNPPHTQSIDIQAEILTVQADIQDIEAFYNVKTSMERCRRLWNYYHEKLAWLQTASFSSLNQDDQIDYLLLRSHMQRQMRKFVADEELDRILEFWWQDLLVLISARQAAEPMEGQAAASKLDASLAKINDLRMQLQGGDKLGLSRFGAYRVVGLLKELQGHFEEWFAFYSGYDPLFTWWVEKPYTELQRGLKQLKEVVRERVVGLKPEDEDAIVGQPVGREALLDDLEAEFIPYSPEELISIAHREYSWCEAEMIKASQELDCGKDWRAALEKVKKMYVAPGQQTQLVRELSAETIKYVKDRDMVTIPPIAEETIRTYMMSPAQQKANPFFLGGPYIMASYPTNTMSHRDKLMSMRGNNIPFSRSTVFHELIPGHHLQWHYMARYKTHRRMFQTPFWIEGWSFYWEMILYQRGFPATPENKIGMLFWRMHRCIRIIFSLKFHLGELTPEECIDMLVAKVGHERATAEGEVRRSFNGDYGPLYQAGYMLGALQFRKLREEVVRGGMGEKEFHDRVLRESCLPVELLRARLTGQELRRDFKSEWRFYDL